MRPSPIERIPRGTAEYEAKLAAQSPAGRLIVELAEESILSDRSRSHSRRRLPNGTIIDLTAYGEFDVLISIREFANGDVEFIDFKIYDPL